VSPGAGHPLLPFCAKGSGLQTHGQSGPEGYVCRHGMGYGHSDCGRGP
jgi:hypothetical protein